jgi:hypothetical protein
MKSTLKQDLEAFDTIAKHIKEACELRLHRFLITNPRYQHL